MTTTKLNHKIKTSETHIYTHQTKRGKNSPMVLTYARKHKDSENNENKTNTIIYHNNVKI